MASLLPVVSQCKYQKKCKQHVESGPGLPMTMAPPAMPPATAPMGTPADLEAAVGAEGGSTATGLGLLTAGTDMALGKPAMTTSTLTSVRLMVTPTAQVKACQQCLTPPHTRASLQAQPATPV